MRTFTLAELNSIPTLEVGHTDDLKINHPSGLRVWLSRLTIADGHCCNNEVTVEKRFGNAWLTIDTYSAI